MADTEEYSSSYLSDAVSAFMRLPGVGRRSAQRYALHMLGRPLAERRRFVEDIRRFLEEVQYCPICHGLSDDGNVCNICASRSRDRSVLCVVADTRDVMAIERSQSYRGMYYVLGGTIDPMQGIGPSQLPIEQLLATIEKQGAREVILAFGATTEGDTTQFYLQRRMAHLGVTISQPARGVSLGETLEQTDGMTLGTAFAQRVVLNRTAEAKRSVTEIDNPK